MCRVCDLRAQDPRGQLSFVAELMGYCGIDVASQSKIPLSRRLNLPGNRRFERWQLQLHRSDAR